MKFTQLPERPRLGLALRDRRIQNAFLLESRFETLWPMPDTSARLPCPKFHQHCEGSGRKRRRIIPEVLQQEREAKIGE